MPLYEYRCKACSKEIEVMQKFSDPRLETCESCGGELKKLVSNTSFILKGTGWYVTDYGRKDQKKAMKEGEASGSSGDSSGKSSASEGGTGSSAGGSNGASKNTDSSSSSSSDSGSGKSSSSASASSA